MKGRILIIADGATSKLATAMGYCTEAPKGVCSRAYVEGGTHNTKFDGAACLTTEQLNGEAGPHCFRADQLGTVATARRQPASMCNDS